MNKHISAGIPKKTTIHAGAPMRLKDSAIAPRNKNAENAGSMTASAFLMPFVREVGRRSVSEVSPSQNIFTYQGERPTEPKIN